MRVNPAHRERQVLHHAPYRGEDVHLRNQGLADEPLTFVDGHSVAVAGKGRDDGVVCVTNRRRWVGDPPVGRVRRVHRRTGVWCGSASWKPAQGTSPGRFSRSPPALVGRQRPPEVQDRGGYRRTPGGRLRSKPQAPAWFFRMLLRPAHCLSLTQEQTPGNASWLDATNQMQCTHLHVMWVIFVDISRGRHRRLT